MFSGIIVQKAHGVIPQAGLAKQLLDRCEERAKEKGCPELAGDCEIDNEVSLQVHPEAGFREANRIICFTKKL